MREGFEKDSNTEDKMLTMAGNRGPMMVETKGLKDVSLVL